jgi:hypothetical protein
MKPDGASKKEQREQIANQMPEQLDMQKLVREQLPQIALLQPLDAKREIIRMIKPSVDDVDLLQRENHRQRDYQDYCRRKPGRMLLVAHVVTVFQHLEAQ